jgi:membrane protease YdiL (CAAX protease family)
LDKARENPLAQGNSGLIPLGLRRQQFYGLGRMPILALAFYIAAVFIGGAIAAPQLYWAAQSMERWFPHLAGIPFTRFVHRSLLLVALLGLWPLFRSLGAVSWSDLGIVAPRRHWQKLGAGFTLGFFSLAMVAVTAIGAGARTATLNHHHLVQNLILAGTSALAVGILEEILFRGGIFGALRKNVPWVTALLISSGIYALVHFFGNPHQDGPILWYSGLEILQRMLEGFVHWQQLVPGFFNLALASALLALAYQRTGNLYFSIGFHASWIFWLRSYNVLTRGVTGTNTWIWGGNKMIDGWLAMAVLALTLLFVIFLPAPALAPDPSSTRAPV